jgi:hypothetical protein
MKTETAARQFRAAGCRVIGVDAAGRVVPVHHTTVAAAAARRGAG